MIRGLQRVGWKKVDVNFHSAVWPLFAHSNMHVLHPLNLLFEYADITDIVYIT